MGYMGLGMQRWISTMKPRKFLGKRSKPDGGGVENQSKENIQNYYTLKPRKLKKLLSRKYNINYRQKLKQDLKDENKANNLKIIISAITVTIIFIFLVLYMNLKFDWF